MFFFQLTVYIVVLPAESAFDMSVGSLFICLMLFSRKKLCTFSFRSFLSKSKAIVIIDKNDLKEKVHSSINFLDLIIHRKENNMDISIYRKATNTDTTIHYLSNHPFAQKIAAFIYYINRLISLPISQESRDMEWATILTMAKNNGFPEDIIRRLRTKLLTKKHKKTNHGRT